MVLVVSSPVFEALLYGPIADTSGTIRVPDVEPHIFTLLLESVFFLMFVTVVFLVMFCDLVKYEIIRLILLYIFMQNTFLAL